MQTLSSSEVIDLKYKNGVASLVINEVFPEDEGEYTCKATNSVGTTSTSCKLSVKRKHFISNVIIIVIVLIELCLIKKKKKLFYLSTAMKQTNGKKSGSDKPPKIVDHLLSMYVKDGESVVLSCRIIGAKKFDVVWLHNNKEIKPGKDFQYSNEAHIYKLTIAEIFPEDSGTYTCEAFNDAGESFSSCTLNVLGNYLIRIYSTNYLS